MKWEPVQCRAGDMIRIRLGSLYHYGIFVSEDEVIQFGLPPTAENRAKEGEPSVLATDIDVFACGCIIETAVLDRSESKRRLPAEETVSRARAAIGKGGYNIIHNNCEHFVNECVFGEARCLQAEDVRRRWLSRPICDVYIAVIPENVSGVGIFPERRKAEIDNISSPEERNAARFLWKLLGYAAGRSFNTDLKNAGFKRQLMGKWVCDSFSFSLSERDGLAAVAVSNADVSLRLGKDIRRKGVCRTLKNPRMPVEVSGKNSSAVKYFWVEDGSSFLMGGKYFE